MGTTPTSGPESRHDPTNAFAELALITVDATPPEQTLRRVAELAKQTLDGVEDVSLTVVEDGHPRSMVFTGRLAVDLDERQYELGFGPCLDAAKTGQTVVLDTTDEHSPYREFGRIAARAGVRHTVSLGLPIAQRSIGGLNVYCTAAAPLSAAFVQHAEVFVAYAAVAVNNVASYAGAVNEAAGLRTAMASRAVIEQAKGILMGRDHCTAEEAFDLLKRISSHRNVKLRDIAQAVVEEAQK